MRLGFFFLFGLAGLGLSSLTVAAANTSAGIAPAPAWVAALEPAPARDAGDLTAVAQYGQVWLLVDSQINLEEKAAYEHLCYQVTSSSGVQGSGRVSVSYDPEYEKVEFEFVRIRRGGAVLNRLVPEKIKTIQQESDLERYQYNGRLTALLLLDDVRVGDVIDYAYTRRGWNPVFGGRYFTERATQWNMPIEREEVRLLYSPARHFTRQEQGGQVLRSTSRVTAGLQDDRLTAEGLKAIIPDPNLPTWYSPFPLLQVTEFPSWGSVVDWGLTLYSVPTQFSAAVREKTAALAHAGMSDEEKTLAILNFVQREIRYLGIELGLSSHRPTPPNQVFDQRYGDCKDKVLLLCSMLKLAGITAVPALTHSQRSHLSELPPSPGDFDHVIARVTLDGAEYWLDPTIREQGGLLGNRYVPNYGFALPIIPRQQALEPVRTPLSAIPTHQTEERYTLGDVEHSTELEVTSIYSGGAADGMREYLATRARDEVAKYFINYRIRYTGPMEWIRPYEVEDDPVRNRVTVRSAFLLKKFWKPAEKAGRFTVEFFPWTLHDHLDVPEAINRSMPLGVAYPVDIRYSIDVALFGAWPKAETSTAVDNDYFAGSRTIQGAGQSLHLGYTFRSKVDAVPAPEAAVYAEAMKSFRDKIGYTLTYDPAFAMAVRSFQLDWVNFSTLLATLILGGVGVWWLCRGEAAGPAHYPPVRADIGRLSGWLVLLAVSVALLPLGCLISAVKLITPLLDHRVMLVFLRTPAIKNPSLAFWTVVGEIAGSGLKLVGAIGVCILFYNRRRRFPAALTALLIFFPLWWAANEFVSHFALVRTKGGAENVIRLLASACLWIPYLWTSRRVRQRFVE